ncbi:MAG: hypothetical protein Q9166_002546, partial [cf. Caloplaca sp. 2 TL-2023]
MSQAEYESPPPAVDIHQRPEEWMEVGYPYAGWSQPSTPRRPSDVSDDGHRKKGARR